MGVLVNAHQAAELAGIHERNLRRHIYNGVLPAEKVGRAYQIDVDDLVKLPGGVCSVQPEVPALGPRLLPHAAQEAPPHAPYPRWRRAVLFGAYLAVLALLWGAYFAVLALLWGAYFLIIAFGYALYYGLRPWWPVLDAETRIALKDLRRILRGEGQENRPPRVRWPAMDRMPDRAA